MSNTTLSPNMNLPVPNVGEDPGPTWAEDNNSCLEIIDGHNHTAGSGVAITPAGININTDLPFNSFNATGLNSAAMFNGGTSIPLCAVYVSGGNLYYKNSGGTAVQITNGGSVNAGAGSITGLPSGTASVAFAASTYVFQSATSTAANLDAGSVILRNTTASAHGVTLNPANALAADYSLFLPLIPASSSILTIDTSGNIGGSISLNGGITGTNIAAATITGSNIATGTITGAQIGSGVITGANVASNINLPGNSVQENGKDVVVSAVNPSGSLQIIRGTVTTGSGSISAGEGFSVVGSSTGATQLSWAVAFADTPVVVAAPGFASDPGSSTVYSAFAIGASTTGVALKSLAIISSPLLVNIPVSFIAIGIRT